jgi:hypothetical protein
VILIGSLIILIIEYFLVGNVDFVDRLCIVIWGGEEGGRSIQSKKCQVIEVGAGAYVNKSRTLSLRNIPGHRQRRINFGKPL